MILSHFQNHTKATTENRNTILFNKIRKHVKCQITCFMKHSEGKEGGRKIPKENYQG